MPLKFYARAQVAREGIRLLLSQLVLAGSGPGSKPWVGWILLTTQVRLIGHH